MHDHDKPQQATTPPPTHEPLDTTDVPTGPAELLALQRSIGNAAVARMFGAPAVQRSAVHDVLRSAGRPLDTPVRSEMEARLGADFSDVRVHTDAAARRSAAELGAHAYTAGNHVVVGAGGGDRHTLAHELTHVIQQRSGPVSATPMGDGVSVSDPGDAYERAAEANASRVMAGPTPTAHGHDHATDPHAGHDHAVQRTPVVQRMTMNDFNQTLAQHGLTGQADFITFFEIQRGREDPAAVVADPAPASANRLQQLVQHNDVTAAKLAGYIAEYQQGANGTRAQPAQVANPRVAGMEMEMRNALVVREEGMRNGQVIAHTPVTTDIGDIPVMTLVIEGMDPGEPGMELVYGPLPVDDYRNPDLISARNKLKAAIRRPGTAEQMVAFYNGSLRASEQRYRLVDGDHPQRRKGGTPTPRISTQTNVSTRYATVGTTNQNEQRDFSAFYENENGRKMYRKAREKAVALVNEITANWATQHQAAAGPLNHTPYLASLLTHLIHQEAMYLNHELDRDVVRRDDKHHFHALFKISPQDAVMTILTDADARLLLAWLVRTRATPLSDAAVAAFGTLGSTRSNVTLDAEPIHKYLVDVLVARLLAGRQLIKGADDATRTSPIYGDTRQVGKVTHVHPRPSARLRIVIDGTRYYFVVEQRSSGHPINYNAESNPQTAVNQIKDLQR